MKANLKRQIGICIFIVDIVSVLLLIYMVNINKIWGYIASQKGIDFIIQYSDSVDDVEKEILYEGLELVDNSVKDSFLKHNGHIVVLNQSEFIDQIQKDAAKGLPNKTRLSYEGIAGYCGVAKRDIIVGTETTYIIILNKDYMGLSVQHEFGHYIDYIANEKGSRGIEFDPISNSDEFQAIWLEEKDNSGLGEYFTNNSEEFFAESYHALKICPDTYYERCPKTCEFINRIVDTI